MSNALYALAKKITLDAGYDYTDPRTGKTTKVRRPKNRANSFEAWLRKAKPGQKYWFAPNEERTISLAANAALVARGCTLKPRRRWFCIRLNYRIGEGLHGKKTSRRARD